MCCRNASAKLSCRKCWPQSTVVADAESVKSLISLSAALDGARNLQAKLQAPDVDEKLAHKATVFARLVLEYAHTPAAIVIHNSFRTIMVESLVPSSLKTLLEAHDNIASAYSEPFKTFVKEIGLTTDDDDTPLMEAVFDTVAHAKNVVLASVESTDPVVVESASNFKYTTADTIIAASAIVQQVPSWDADECARSFKVCQERVRETTENQDSVCCAQARSIFLKHVHLDGACTAGSISTAESCVGTVNALRKSLRKKPIPIAFFIGVAKLHRLVSDVATLDDAEFQDCAASLASIRNKLTVQVGDADDEVAFDVSRDILGLTDDHRQSLMNAADAAEQARLSRAQRLQKEATTVSSKSSKKTKCIQAITGRPLPHVESEFDEWMVWMREKDAGAKSTHVAGMVAAQRGLEAEITSFLGKVLVGGDKEDSLADDARQELSAMRKAVAQSKLSMLVFAAGAMIRSPELKGDAAGRTKGAKKQTLDELVSYCLVAKRLHDKEHVLVPLWMLARMAAITNHAATKAWLKALNGCAMHEASSGSCHSPPRPAAKRTKTLNHGHVSPGASAKCATGASPVSPSRKRTKQVDAQPPAVPCESKPAGSDGVAEYGCEHCGRQYSAERYSELDCVCECNRLLSALDAPGAAAAAAAGVAAAPTEAAAGPPVAGDTEAPSTENEPPLPPPATIPPEPDAPSAENEPSVARLQENGFTALPLQNKEVPAPSAPGNDGAPEAQEPVVHTTKAAKSVANVARAATKAAAKAAADAAKAVAAKARELDAAEPTTKNKGRGKGKRPRAAAKP